MRICLGKKKKEELGEGGTEGGSVSLCESVIEQELTWRRDLSDDEGC